MIGAHSFKFGSAAVALAALATLPGFDVEAHQLRIAEQTGEYVVVDWGVHHIETGNTVSVDGVEVPETAALPGHWVYLLTPDALPPEGWEAYTAVDRADAPLVEIGGWYGEQQDGQDQAEITDTAVVVTGAPVAVTAEQREALRDIRAQRLAIIEPWQARIKALRTQREAVGAFNKAINTDLPGRSDEAQTRIQAIISERASLVTDRDAQAGIAADTEQPSAARQAARDERDRINGEIDKLIAEQASLVALRQSIAASLPGMRADRTAAIAERATMFASVQADRPGVLSALAALRAQRDAILGA